MVEKQQEWQLLPRLCIGKIISYLQVKKLLGAEKTQDLLNGWKPISYKGKVQKIEAWFKNQSILSDYLKKGLAQNKDNSPVKNLKPSQAIIFLNKCQKGQAGLNEQSEGQAKGKAQVEQALPPELQSSKKGRDKNGKCVQYGKAFDGI
ncbi:hypothetical protein O181_043144 [Austropuccinia psidii MF-1]|uniref:Uncharacterized protein n=1 Tax=Austropuccinia psidii MF-1 TaxID=1389203 RepID=A0A9Q3DHQ7_9BASI|nr:hypothetical protein [Austropuccinia psidii MF-1]